MPLTVGTTLGSYEVVSPLGAGGMGEVYRARDAQLGRDVALKVLPASFTQDADRVARFEREAQILASLNHPNIAAIYGLERAESIPFLVLELVEGETLDQKIDRGAIPLVESLAIARQIADALDAAHAKGVVHRDLKPANVAITGDGVVKVLDFGLAKAMDLTTPAADQSRSPTITFAATQAGTLLGTAAYMSPEQAKGQAVDKRTDIWAFGCVLFEMLTGRRAFAGEDITETIAAIVRDEPAWGALPASVPDQIRLLIRRCVEKDRRTRISDIAVARFLMHETLPLARVPDVGGMVAHRSHAREVASAVFGAIAGVLLTGLAVRMFVRAPVAPLPRTPVRFPIIAPALQGIALQGADRNLDISADGSFLVYRGGAPGSPQLFLRRFDELDTRSLGVGMPDPRSPFISPDGGWVGYFSGVELRKMATAGGTPLVICRVPGAPRGASWGSDGIIVFATNDVGSGLMTVPAEGGQPKPLLRPAAGAPPYGFPSTLPDGNIVLFTIGTPGGSPETVSNSQIAALNRATGAVKVILRGGSQPRYQDGFLIYGTAGTLRGVRFDPGRLEVIGDSIPLVDQVQMTPQGAANFAVARDGSLAYIPATAVLSGRTLRTIVWAGRDGREEALRLPPRPYESVRLSPDGTRIAVGVRDGQNDIWVGDVSRDALTRLTFDPTVDQAPVWTPDGTRIIWSSQRGTNGNPNLYMQAADGTGEVQQLSDNPNPTFSTSITPDGKHVLAWQNSPLDRQDIVQVAIGPRGQPPAAVQPLVHTPAVELDAELSPDGRWLAYQSDESGRVEIFVRRYPEIDAGRWQASTEGGTRPLWARSGRELFYFDASGSLLSVEVDPSAATFVAKNPKIVIASKYYMGFTGLGLDLRAYDVSRDGRRFLMLRDTPNPSPTSTPQANLIVVLHWIEELKARLPAK